jgi:hypothetical protein
VAEAAVRRHLLRPLCADYESSASVVHTIARCATDGAPVSFAISISDLAVSTSQTRPCRRLMGNHAATNLIFGGGLSAGQERGALVARREASHAERVARLLEAAHVESERSGFDGLGPRPIGLELVVSCPRDSSRSDATNYLGGAATSSKARPTAARLITSENSRKSRSTTTIARSKS